MRILTAIRMIAIMLVIGIFCWRYIRLRISRKNNQDNDEKDLLEHFEKDENGLFPWEIDTDDSPDRIPHNAKRHPHISGRPRRGRW